MTEPSSKIASAVVIHADGLKILLGKTLIWLRNIRNRV